GMGMTNELSVGFYVKRLMLLNNLLGDSDHHQRLFAELEDSAETSAERAA
ncbi:MAG: pimeloyl-CoA dehydrogenase small subunit, partial [Halieaceae bacterium]|nr:pimeloyl-CoA dehydrogenase small subunit [Halieaceae bacterium]